MKYFSSLLAPQADAPVEPPRPNKRQQRDFSPVSGIMDLMKGIGDDTVAIARNPNNPTLTQTSIAPPKPLSKPLPFASYNMPRGTFMRVILLNGVDAPTGGQAQSNPVPIVMSVVDYSNMPNDFRSDVTNCRVIANASGDLSSERAYMRLEGMSCITAAGEVIDVPLSGYVSGEDGSNGVRGTVVSKQGRIIAYSIMAGIIGGLGTAAAQEGQNQTATIAGVATTTTNPWKSGLGSGLQTAGNRISDYYLKLADQLFPVIEISSGRYVDIVLTKGVVFEREFDTDKS